MSSWGKGKNLSRFVELAFAILLAFLANLARGESRAAMTSPDLSLVKRDSASISVQNQFLVFEDKSGQLSPNEVLSKLSDFKQPSENGLTFGYSLSTFWVLLTIENQSALEELELASNYPVLELEVLRIADLQKGFFEREKTLARRTPSSSLHIPYGSKEKFLVRVRSTQFVNLHFKVSDKEEVLQTENRENMFYAMLFGCFLAVFVSNFVLFMVLRHRSYLYYLIFSLVNCHLTFLAMKFPGDILSWFGVNWGVLAHPYSTFGGLTTMLFVRNFLHTKQDFPKLDWAMRLFMVGLLLIASLELWSYSPVYPNFADLYYQIGIVLLFVVGVQSYRKGFIPSKYYLLSLSSFLVGIVIYLSQTLGFLPSNLFTLNALVIGQTGEMILMSFALSSKLKIVERESARSIMKTQLLKLLAHDLANPLSIIKMSAQYAKKLGPERSLEQISKASEIIEHILQYIHEKRVLDIYVTPKLEAVSVDDAFRDASFAHKDKAALKGVEIKLQKPEAGLLVKAVKSALTQQVIGNLVSNAIKFSSPGSAVELRAYVLARGKIALEVRDHGDGMEKAKIHELLRENHRNESTFGTSGEKGFGYGISIVKDVLKDFRGTLEIESVLRKENPQKSGTVMRVVLRRALVLSLRNYSLRERVFGQVQADSNVERSG